LQDKNVEVRCSVAWALGKIGAVEAVPALIQALQVYQDVDVRQWVTEALVEIGKGAVPALIGALQDADKGVRYRAAEALVEGKGAVPALIQALQDQHEFVRRQAAEALGCIGEGAKEAVPALIQALQNQDVDIHQLVTEALLKIGKEAIPALIELLQDHDVDVRRHTAGALNNIGTPEALKAVEGVRLYERVPYLR
jgi:HEAT repeat protein